MVTPAGEREAVAHLVQEHEVSQRRACEVLGCCRMTVRYRSIRPDDAGLRERMRTIAHERRRFGYRRIHIMLKREGTLVNHKKLFRLYREEKLTVRKRGGRKRAIGSRCPALVPLLPNMRWSLDFVSDQLTDGRRFRVLTLLMTARVNVWRWWRILRCQDCALPANSITSSHREEHPG
jgi:putative transposase